MPLRITEAELRSYMDLNPAETHNLVIYMNQANMLVDEELGSSGLSSNRLKYIELNLAGHYAVLGLERGGLTRQRAGEAEEGYRQDFTSKPNLSMTRFGQQAIALDPTGKLSSMNAPVGKAEFRVM